MQENLIKNGQNIYPKQQGKDSNPVNHMTSKYPNKKTVYRYSKRSLFNILLIIFCTFEVIMITNTKVYIDSSMVRSFLTFYADRDLYPDVFDGLAYYIKIQDIGQLQKIMQYMLTKMNSSESQTRNNLNFHQANISFEVQYHADVERYENQTTYIIDLSKGIVEPFDLENTTDLQLFLLKTHFFEIVVENLQVNKEGLNQNYDHRIIYCYKQNSQISMNFQFKISNILASTLDYDRPQAHELLYLRIFYLTIITLAMITFYNHALYVRRSFKQLYTHLQHKKHHTDSCKVKRRGSIFKELNTTQIVQMDRNISAYVESRNLNINSLTWKDYMRVVQFDVIFAMVACFLQVISNFYLLFGREHEQVTGLGCLLAWLTIFRVVQRFQKLTLMYELIKISIWGIVQFSASFFILFLGYAFFGVAVFPKVSFFASVSDSVTTLFSMLAGDSIDMITMSIVDKYSAPLAICYIFSYIIMFMHAIHNTLTSIIKQYFILRKIEQIKEQKQKKGEQNFIYIQELSMDSEQQKDSLPLKLTYSLQKDLYKIKKEKTFKEYDKTIRSMVMRFQNLLLVEKMEQLQHGQSARSYYLQDLQKRWISIRKTIESLLVSSKAQELRTERKKTITNEQL